MFRYQYTYTFIKRGMIPCGMVRYGNISPVKLQMIELASSPIRFTDLMLEVKRSKKRVADHINELERLGLIQKLENGKYTVTDNGKLFVLSENVKRDIENLPLEQEDLVELQRELDRLPSVRTFREHINELLMKNGPMHYKKLTEQILKVKPTRGKTPDQTVLAILERGSRGPNPRYVRVGPGTYGLNPFYQPNVKSTRVKQLDGKLYVDLTEQLKLLNIKEDDEVNVAIEDGKIVIH
jgi:predicted transcriptional regulator